MINIRHIRNHAEHMPDHIAIDDGKQAVSWKTMSDETEVKVGRLLDIFGDSLPAQACYIAHNSIALIQWLAACTTLSIGVTGLDYTLPQQGLCDLMRRLDPRLLFVDDALEASSLLASYGKPLSVIHIGACTSTTGKVNADINRRISGNGHVERVYRAVGLTSGTTGHPKLVIRKKSFDVRRFAYFTGRYGFNSHDRFLVAMPLYHAAGNGWARMFMGLGATLFLAPINRPDAIAQCIEVLGVTASVMTPVLLARTLDAIECSGTEDKLALRWLLIGGKHFPVPQKKRALSILGPVVHEYFGTTETGVNTIADPADMETYPESVGRPFEGNDVAVVGVGGNLLDPGEDGAICVASYMNMDDYDGGGAARITLKGQNYLLTSDIGHLDESGRLYLINRSGARGYLHNLYRLEDAIRCISGVSDVALWAPNGRSDVEIGCAIEPVATNTEKGRSLLVKKAQDLVASEHLRCGPVCVVHAIPYSPSGKVRVSDLDMMCDAKGDVA